MTETDEDLSRRLRELSRRIEAFKRRLAEKRRTSLWTRYSGGR